MYNKINVNYPAYFEKFKCIGGECEETCCQGWDIEIDKDTFEQYCNIKDEGIRSVVKSNICLNEDCESSDLDYGVIKLNEHSICPFLDEHKYCSLYSKVGEESLSNICTHFPRILNKINHEYEISLDPACPEAGRLILLCEEKIEFHRKDMVFTKYIVNDEYNTNSKKYKNSPVKYFKEIREACIKILQNREFKIAERLYILGDFLEQLDKEEVGNIPMFIKNYSMNCEIDEKNNYIIQSIFFKDLVNHQDMEEAFKESIINIPDVYEKDEEYIRVLKECDKHFLIDKSHIFENYLVNFMYGSLFPFSESDYIMDGYIMLIVRYCYIKFSLFISYLNEGNNSDEDIIRFIMSFGRDVEHNTEYLSEIMECIKESETENIKLVKKLL